MAALDSCALDRWISFVIPSFYGKSTFYRISMFQEQALWKLIGEGEKKCNFTRKLGNGPASPNINEQISARRNPFGAAAKR